MNFSKEGDGWKYSKLCPIGVGLGYSQRRVKLWTFLLINFHSWVLPFAGMFVAYFGPKDSVAVLFSEILPKYTALWKRKYSLFFA
jgi:hypothetical protein